MSLGGRILEDDNRSLAEAQASDERQMFGEFLTYARLPVIESTIESQLPPAPDILCQLTCGERIAFELGELSDPAFRKGASTMMQFRRMLWQLFQELPDDIREVMAMRYRECRIEVTFQPDVSLRRYGRAAKAYYHWLADQPRIIGTLTRDQFPADVGAVIPRVCISEPSPTLWIEPDFRTRVSESDLSVFEKKAGKRYDQSHPIELLLHSTWPLSDAWFARHADALQSGIEKGPFRRMWIFSPTERTYRDPVRFVFPEYREFPTRAGLDG